MAVITGGSRGIGRGIALRLARDGAHCAITYRKDAPSALEAVAELEALGVRAVAERLELAELEQVAPVFERIGAALGRVDVLVANAAAAAFRPVLEQKAHNVRRTFAISVDAFVAMTQAAVPLMKGRPGRIVLISGIDSFQAMAGHTVLGAAKAASSGPTRRPTTSPKASASTTSGRPRASSRPPRCAGTERPRTWRPWSPTWCRTPRRSSPASAS